MLSAIEAFFTAAASLWSLLLGSLIAATLAPVSSEAMLFAVLMLRPDLYFPAIAVATTGNTAGGMISYAMGRFIPHCAQIRHEAWLKRHRRSSACLGTGGRRRAVRGRRLAAPGLAGMPCVHGDGQGDSLSAYRGRYPVVPRTFHRRVGLTVAGYLAV